ncbi:hypothetical protein DFJ58DRAFT_769789 [Suillus subalutaceus]|uniref:uncharacterized protein n=1 Tax=Suillus subalutaceus TaxID=48586 RepID=UPI001B870FF7|nr:uncharacterized protein DFJ58DRAFT_769789 [Suillus subalutaceus]KAG1866572.1 hypothetical protein DFJ58DRAFT_769789 [Suillus subalutaceus]
MDPTQSISEHRRLNDFEIKLIQYIETHQSKGRGLVDFDKSFWIDAATEMAKQGTPTTADACQSSWTEIHHVVEKWADGLPGLRYTPGYRTGVTTQSEAIRAKSMKNHPQAKPLGHETVQNLISSNNLKNVSPPSTRRKNVFDDILNPTTIDCSNSESDDEDIYVPSVSVSASQRAASLHAFEQLGESLKQLISALEYTPETSSFDLIPLRKQRAIVQVQKEDLQDDEILSLIHLFQGDVKIADSYLAIERDGVRKLFLASYLKK